MIEDCYDFLKYLVDNMSPETHKFVDKDGKLLNMVDPYKQQEYLTHLKNWGLVRVFVRYIHVCDSGIDLVNALYDI